jgi:hypothetical protein
VPRVSVIATVSICALLTGAVVTATPANANGCITQGAGTSGDPFLISSIANLECLRDNASYYAHHGYYFKQTADLDLSATADWTHGIGDDTYTFDGTYDGNGWAIEGLAINGTTKVGLFSHVNGATLTDITLVDPAIASTGPYVGVLAGLVDDTTSINDVHVINGGAGATVTSGGNASGGLVGAAAGATTISDSSSAASVSGGFTGMSGGLVGSAQDVVILDSFATGNAASFGASGALVGWARAPVSIARSYATGAAADSVSGSGGLIGVAVTDDTHSITIEESFAMGSSTSFNGYAGGLVGATEQIGPAGGQPVAIADSYATGLATGRWAAGGLVGQANAVAGPSVTLLRAYAVGAVDATDVTADDSAGGLLGVDALSGAADITDSFWNPTDSGPAATAAYGTESSRAAMASPSLYSSGGWSISDSLTAGTTWVSCVVNNSGYPFLEWYAVDRGWTCSPTPPPIYPPSAPLNVAGVAGDRAVSVSWSPPESTGSFGVSTYQVISTPPGGSCLGSATSCEVTGLRNGTAYSFTVRALNGAGWSPWSSASAAVTPTAPVVASIVISGVRGDVRGEPGVIITGTSNLRLGAIVVPWMRFPGQTSFEEGSARLMVDASGGFTWERRTGKKISVYVVSDEWTSNRVIVRSIAAGR